MNHVFKRCLQGTLLAGGLWVIGAGIASADTTSTAATATPIGHSLVSAVAPVNVPITVCGNGILGRAASCGASAPAASSAAVAAPAAATSTSTPRTGLVSAVVPVNVPVTVCGNSVLARAASCSSAATGSSATAASASGSTGHHGGGLSASAPINVPVTVCGNAVLGAKPSCGGATPAAGSSATATHSSGSTGNADDGLLSALAPVNVPVTVCGNSVAGGPSGCGDASSASSTSTGTTGSTGSTGNRGGGSLAAVAPINVPVTVCGNAVLGAASSCGAATPAAGSSSTATGSAGPNDGLLSALAPVNAPVTVCGNSVVGGASGCGSTESVATSTTGTTGDPGSTGNPGPGNPVLGTISLPISLPVTVCGNGLLTDASSSCGAEPVATTSTTPTSPTPPAIPTTEQTSAGVGANLAFDTASDKGLAFTGSPVVKMLAIAALLLSIGTALLIGGVGRRDVCEPVRVVGRF